MTSHRPIFYLPLNAAPLESAAIGACPIGPPPLPPAATGEANHQTVMKTQPACQRLLHVTKAQ